MSFFTSSAITTVSSVVNAAVSKIDESNNAENELTKKITEAEIEIESFSLEPDEGFFDNTTNKKRD